MNQQNLIANPNIVNPNAPAYGQMEAREARVTARDNKTGQGTDIMLRTDDNANALQVRTDLPDSSNIELSIDMHHPNEPNRRTHNFRMTFTSWQNLFQLLAQTNWERLG